MNASHEDREFTLPQPILPWRLLIDSVDADAPERSLDQPTVTVGHRAAIVLVTTL
jgi:hypothetical protein